jgi:hypothetical protein
MGEHSSHLEERDENSCDLFQESGDDESSSAQNGMAVVSFSRRRTVVALLVAVPLPACIDMLHNRRYAHPTG